VSSTHHQIKERRTHAATEHPGACVATPSNEGVARDGVLRWRIRPEGDAAAAGSDDVEGAGSDHDLLSVTVPEAQQRVRTRR